MKLVLDVGAQSERATELLEASGLGSRSVPVGRTALADKLRALSPGRAARLALEMMMADATEFGPTLQTTEWLCTPVKFKAPKVSKRPDAKKPATKGGR